MFIKFDCPRTCRHFETVDLCRFMALIASIGPSKVNSHLVKVDVEIRDLEALRRAGKTLGMTLTESKTYRWWGRSVGDYPIPEGFTADELGKCDYKLSCDKFSSAYEVGVFHRDDQYKLLFDFYGSQGADLQSVLGENGCNLVAEYTLELATSKANELGWMAERTGEGVTIYHPSGGSLTVTGAGEVEAHGFHGAGCHEATGAIGAALGSASVGYDKPEANETKTTLKQQ
jgi:hypothetical protein